MSKINIYLPSKIKEGVNRLKLPDQKTNEVLFFLSVLIGKYRKDNITLDDYIPIDYQYKKLMLSSQYATIWRKLETEFFEVWKIDNVKEYSYKQGICKHYRFKTAYRILELNKYEIEYKRRDKRNIEKFVVSQTKEILKNNVTLALPSNLDQYLDDTFSTPKMLKDIYSQISTQTILSDSKNIKYLHYTKEGVQSKKATFKEITRSKTIKETFVEYKYRNKKRYFLIESFNVHSFAAQRLDELKASHKYALTKILDKDFYCDVSETNGRLHTNLSELGNIHFQYLRINGEHVAQFDAKNSQLTFLSAILGSSIKYIEKNIIKPYDSQPQKSFKGFKEIIKGNNKEIETIKRIENKRKEIIKKASLITLFIKPIPSNCKSIDCAKIKSVKIFIEKCKEGTVYEWIYGHLFGDLCSTLGKNKLIGKERQKVKIIVFEILFSVYYNQSDEVKKFKECFPYVFEILSAFKKMCKELIFDKELASIKKKLSKQNKFTQKQIERVAQIEFKNKFGGSPSKLGSNQLAIMLQTFESDIFIKKILFKLLRKNIVCFSKHDSILFKESDCKKVFEVVNKELITALGMDNFKLSYETFKPKPPKTKEIKKTAIHPKRPIATARKEKYIQSIPDKKRKEEEQKEKRKKDRKDAFDKEVEIYFTEYEKSKIKETGKGFGKGEAARLRERIKRHLYRIRAEKRRSKQTQQR